VTYTVFVRMYHPNLPATATTPADVAEQAVDDWESRGWVRMLPGVPAVTDPHLTQTSGDARYVQEDELPSLAAGHVSDGSDLDVALRGALVPFWAPEEAVAQGAVRMAPTGETIVRIAAGTTGAVYDATEAAGWTVGGTVASTDITDSTATGRAVLTAADAPTARTAIGAGTSSLVLGTTAGTAKAGDYAPPAASETVAGVVELATVTEAQAGTDTARAVTPAGVAAHVEQELAGIAQPDMDVVPAFIWQASDGTWPGRSTVTTSPTRPVEWIGYPGNTTAPPAGGADGAVVERDFYRQRTTS
jgi:hypothetical protein